MSDLERTRKRHKHRFSLFGFAFGPYAPTESHWHDCDDDLCLRVLVGPGKRCDGDKGSHRREWWDDR